jgi:hypothetical protein
MFVSWLSCCTPDTDTAFTAEVVAECVASSRCNVQLQDLLLQRSEVPSEVLSQVVCLLDGLLHVDPWERLECFQIEEAVSVALDLLASMKTRDSLAVLDTVCDIETGR